jgi:transposase
MKTILAAPHLLKIERIALSPDEIRLVVKTRSPKSTCPSCGQHSNKVHSRYQRHLADLPWEGIAAKLVLSVRKFFCLNPECRQRIFCERLSGLAAPYAHKTMRLNELLTSLGRALGGRPGMRMAQGMGLQIGRDALLERVRRAAVAHTEMVRVLGVDDFAFRRGKKYGTILIDHERRATIDLLLDREAETLAQWLKAHPGVEIVTRDRARAYAEGIRAGAPEAVQIADRWHLIRNLSEALEKLLTRQHHLIRDAANPVIEIPQPAPLPQPEPESPPVKEAQPLRTRFPGRLRKEVIERRDRLRALYQEVIELKQKGVSADEIAKRVGKSPRTIRHWLQQGEYRERVRHRRSKLDAHFSYLTQRWNEGCHNVMELWRELRGRGYRGSYKSLNNYLHRQNYLRHRERPSSTVRVQPQGVRLMRQARIETLIPTPSPRKTVWMLLKPEELEEKERKMIDHLCRLSPEVKAAQELASSFIAMIRERRAERFDGWIGQVVESHIPELKSFADSLKQDQPAVVAALTYEWSNGMVEGQVNRLKLVKRTMYGRAKPDLLKARMLKAA